MVHGKQAQDLSLNGRSYVGLVSLVPGAIDSGTGTQQDDPKTQKKYDSAPKRNALPMKIFFLVVSLGLSLSTITGLYMSYMYCRNKVGVTAVLLAGVAIPVALAMA